MELFTQLFGDLLIFVYHCFDRVVIHGYLIIERRFEWRPHKSFILKDQIGDSSLGPSRACAASTNCFIVKRMGAGRSRIVPNSVTKFIFPAVLNVVTPGAGQGAPAPATSAEGREL
jgi:hypothetical protein